MQYIQEELNIQDELTDKMAGVSTDRTDKNTPLRQLAQSLIYS